MSVQESLAEVWVGEGLGSEHRVVYVTGDGSKIGCCKEQYCMGTWNIRSMNHRQLDVVGQEMAIVSIDILGICKIK